ncbi:MAG: shikimate kinase [Enterobacteriaceae bacterium]
MKKKYFNYFRYLNIFLIGPTGSGKTFIGKMLSFYLGKIFFDLDELVSLSVKMKINEIFSKKKEKFFRKKEEEISCKTIKSNKGFILSFGAGSISSINITNLLNYGLVIYLKSNIKTQINRLIYKKNRPLIKNFNNYKKSKKLKKILLKMSKTRNFIYKKFSDIEVITDDKNFLEVINDIIFKILNIIKRLNVKG